MKIAHKTIGLTVILVGYGAAAVAATASALIYQLQGQVLVTKTTTTVTARNDMALYAGDRIAAVGGAVTVVYPDGCRVTVPANSTLSIGAANQCSTGQAKVQTVKVAAAPPARRPPPPGVLPPPDGTPVSR